MGDYNPYNSFLNVGQGAVTQSDTSGGGLGTLLGGLGQMALGGLTGGIGNLLGVGLGALTDQIFGTSSPQQSMMDMIEKQWDLGLKNQQALNREGMFNAAGQTGGAVANTYKQRADQLGNSAQAMQSANSLRGYGSQGISNALSQGQNNMRVLQGQFGNLRSDVMNTAGTPASARLSLVDKISQNMGGAQAQNLAASGQMYNQALDNAAKNEGLASQILSQDIMNRYNTQVKPYEANVNTSAISGINAGIGAGAQGQQIAAEKALAVTNPLEGLAGGLGLSGKYDIERQKKAASFDTMAPRYRNYFSNW